MPTRPPVPMTRRIAAAIARSARPAPSRAPEAADDRNPAEGLELLRALRGQPSARPIRVPDIAGGLRRREGSDNLGLFEAAIALLRGERAAYEAWVDFLVASRSAWMGQEVWSHIYGSWHLLCVAAIETWAEDRGRRSLAAAAREWLLHWLCWGLLHRGQSGRVVSAGLRSGGHRPARKSLRELILAVALGETTRPWEPGPDQAPGFEREALDLVRDALRRAARPLREAARAGGRTHGASWQHALEVRPRFGLAVPAFHLLRTTRGVASWCEANANPHTTPILGALEVDGAVRWLPADGGVRVRERFEEATCQRAGDLLIYVGAFNGRQEATLPPGDVLLEMTFGPVDA